MSNLPTRFYLSLEVTEPNGDEHKHEFRGTSVDDVLGRATAVAEMYEKKED